MSPSVPSRKPKHRLASIRPRPAHGLIPAANLVMHGGSLSGRGACPQAPPGKVSGCPQMGGDSVRRQPPEHGPNFSFNGTIEPAPAAFVAARLADVRRVFVLPAPTRKSGGACGQAPLPDK